MRLFLPVILVTLVGCTSISRSARSGYATPDVGQSFDGEFRGGDGRIAREAREELGLPEGKITSKQRDALELSIALKRAEADIESRRDRRLYYKMKGNLRDDNERLYVLQLPNASARARYVSDHNLANPDDNRTEELAAAIEAKDIALGMTQKAVNESWGDPDQVETSGEKVFGVERWRYNRYVSGGEGYRKETRVVYFESGRVTGWERQ